MCRAIMINIKRKVLRFERQPAGFSLMSWKQRTSYPARKVGPFISITSSAFPHHETQRIFEAPALFTCFISPVGPSVPNAMPIATIILNIESAGTRFN